MENIRPRMEIGVLSELEDFVSAEPVKVPQIEIAQAAIQTAIDRLVAAGIEAQRGQEAGYPFALEAGKLRALTGVKKLLKMICMLKVAEDGSLNGAKVVNFQRME